jgi:hypothetical protein
MAKADMDGHVWREHLKTGALLQMLLLRAPINLQPPRALFVAGQSCIQWWATWFKDARAPLAHYGAKNRLAWFSGEVLCHMGYGSILYVGIKQPEMHLYHTYSWNGMAETVPVGFLQARIVTLDPRSKRHSNGKLVVQHPDPDIWQSFNTSNVNAKRAASVAGSGAAKKVRS